MMHVLVVFGLIAGGFALHRLALWLERRGWLYYRDKQPSSSALGNAVLRAQTIVDPSAEYVLEERLREDAALGESADPPEPGSSRS